MLLGASTLLRRADRVLVIGAALLAKAARAVTAKGHALVMVLAADP